jgi:hypothetical protein
MVERKHTGFVKARKKPQYSKRWSVLIEIIEALQAPLFCPFSMKQLHNCPAKYYILK